MNQPLTEIGRHQQPERPTSMGRRSFGAFHDWVCRAAGICEDGHRVAGAVYGWFHEAPNDGCVSGRGDRQVALSHGGFRSVHGDLFDRTGTLLAASAGTSVSVIEVATGKERWRLNEMRNSVHHFAFNPESTRLAACGGTIGIRVGEVKLWDLSTGRELLTLETERGCTSRVAFSEDGQRLYHLACAEQDPNAVMQTWDGTPLPANR